MEGLCSPEAITNLDIESKGPNHTTTIVLKLYYFYAVGPLDLVPKINTF